MRKSRILVYILAAVVILSTIVQAPVVHGVNQVPVFVSKTNATEVTGATISASITTTTGQNQYILVFAEGCLSSNCGGPTGPSISSVADGGDTFSKVNEIDNGAGTSWCGNNWSGGVWQAQVTQSASVSVSVTWSSASTISAITVAVYKNTVGAGATTQVNLGASGSYSLAITTTAGNSAIIDAPLGTEAGCNMGTCAAAVTTFTASQTSRNCNSQSHTRIEFADKTAATAQSYTETATNNGGIGFGGELFLVELKGSPNPTPTVSSVSPTSGNNGDSVTITGTNLNGATTVTFCGDTQLVFTVVSSTSITTFAPNRNQQPNGETCDILVTTASGTSAASTSDQFTYNPAPSTSGGSGGYAGPAVNYAIVAAIIGTIVIIGAVLFLRRR